MTEDPTWLDLANCQIQIPLARLLQLVPRFSDAIMATQKKETLIAAPVQFTNPSEGPAVMDKQNPAVTVIIKGKVLLGWQRS